MQTVGELLEALDVAITKVYNSQEYRTATTGNRYALLKDLENSQTQLEAMVHEDSDLDLTKIQLKLKNKQKGRVIVSFI